MTVIASIVAATIAALGGGAFGAVIGALPSFILCGFFCVVGSLQQIITGNPTFFSLAFGPLFGPQVGFAGGAAALAYAVKYHPEVAKQEGWAYHHGKNILISLGSVPSILVVGALFGAFGQVIKMTIDYITGLSPLYGFAHIAVVVVISAAVHRAVFGYSILGDREKTAKRVGSDVTKTTRFSFEVDEAEPWIPSHYKWGWVFTLGLFVGIISGFVSIVTGNPWLTFGLTAFSLIWLHSATGARPDSVFAGFPVTHHIALPSAVAALAAMPVGGIVYGMVMAAIFGILGALLGEFMERLFYAWGDTHWDPPASSITVTIIIIVILSVSGVLGPNAYQAIGPHAW